VLVHVTPGYSSTRQNGVVQLLQFDKGYPSDCVSRQSRRRPRGNSQPREPPCACLNEQFE
jgi:hypothetical protein